MTTAWVSAGLAKGRRLAVHRLLARRPGFSRQLLRHEKRLEDAREGDVSGIVATTQLMK